MIRGATDPLAVMLEARSVALVGASPRPGSLGARMIEEVAKSASAPRTYLVNPRYDEIGGAPCHAALFDLPEPVDLALLAVPDAALEQQLKTAAATGGGLLQYWLSHSEQRPDPEGCLNNWRIAPPHS